VVYIAGVFRRKPYELELDRLRSLSQSLSGSLNSSATRPTMIEAAANTKARLLDSAVLFETRYWGMTWGRMTTK